MTIHRQLLSCVTHWPASLPRPNLGSCESRIRQASVDASAANTAVRPSSRTSLRDATFHLNFCSVADAADLPAVKFRCQASHPELHVRTCLKFVQWGQHADLCTPMPTHQKRTSLVISTFALSKNDIMRLRFSCRHSEAAPSCSQPPPPWWSCKKIKKHCTKTGPSHSVGCGGAMSERRTADSKRQEDSSVQPTV